MCLLGKRLSTTVTKIQHALVPSSLQPVLLAFAQYGGVGVWGGGKKASRFPIWLRTPQSGGVQLPETSESELAFSRPAI